MDRDSGARERPDPAARLTEAVGALAAIYVTSLDAGEVRTDPEDGTEEAPERSAELADTRRVLAEAIDDLPER